MIHSLRILGFVSAALILALCASGTSLGAQEPASDAATSLRAAELAFARSVAERDRERFASFLDDDAMFLGASVLRGKEAILAAWAPFFAEEGPRLEWEPEVAEVRADGALGITRGPYVLTAVGPAGEPLTENGTFVSVWRRLPDGSWRILFDSGCPPCPTPAPDAD